MRILVSDVVMAEYGERVRAAAPPDAQWATMAADGSVAGLDAGPPDVAFLSNDVFYGPVGAFLALVAEHAGSIRLLQSGAAGTEAPVYRDVIEAGGRVARAHVTAVPLAEHVVWAVLEHYRRPELWREARRERRWQARVLREVAGTTWLVVGLGAIGREVAVRGRAMGARVVGVRRSPDGSEPADEVLTPDAFAARLPEADVVVLAADATRDTEHLADAAFFAAMRPGSVFVNLARGSLVDEAALLAALDRGVPELAVLDVFATEPLPADSPWWDHPHVVLTPHNAGGGEGRLRRAVDVFVENLGRLQRGEALLHEVTGAHLPGAGEGAAWHVTR